MTPLRALVISARAGLENLSPTELAAELARGDAVVVDVREPAEVARGTLPGAVAVPRGLLEFLADGVEARGHPDLRPGRRLVLCSAAGDRSALAAAALQALGRTDVAHLAGGLRAWTAEGRPLRRAGAQEP
ncbi:MAG: rhodanese-like domain-containing protein [Mycobacteriales bacterium]|nr:rhodanese-like domain-containing protein [Mycobacteriales bacterium]